ncbi:MAG: sporulation protein [Ammonifex sp.]|jgi:spore germination protein GerM|nr:MAG: sporulation protein [Ammonifex sp.]
MFFTSPRKRVIAYGLVPAVLCSLALFFAGCGRDADQKPDVRDPNNTKPDISARPVESKVKVTLYFSDREAMYLVPEEREAVKGNKSLEEVIVNELIKGPENAALTRSVPEGTRLLSVSVVDGIAYVNFSKELQTKHWGGSAGETMTVYSIVNSLAKLDGVEKVQFLLEGERMDSLAGHIDITGPVAPQWDLVE